MDADAARGLLTKERDRLEGLRTDQDSEGFGFSDQSGGGGLNDGMGGDAATQIHDQEVTQSIQGHVEAELAEVEAALRRVEDGTYGRCEICSEDIIDERLEARPTTRFCAADAEEGERLRGVDERGTGGLSAEAEAQRRGPA